MAELAQQVGREGHMPERGLVKNVKAKWTVYEDGAMAHEMQKEEFDLKYGMNRYNRRTVRADIPVARIVQTAEEEQWQQKEMLRLERQKQITDEDEQIAHDMAENLWLEAHTEQMQQQFADEEQTRQLLAEDDEILRHDEELALQLQEHEKQKYEWKLLERDQQIAAEQQEVKRSQHRIEAPSSIHENQHKVVTENIQNGDQPLNRLLSMDGKVEDLGDFTNFYDIPESMDENSKQVLQELQDAEVAHLLQEQECKLAGQLKMDAQKAIELQDAELAWIMQEQEKLKEREHKQK